MSDTTITETVPVARANAGEAHWWWGWLAVIKLTGEQTDGRLSVVEVTIPPDRMCPPHVHHREHETWLVTAGQLTFQIGEQTVEAGSGDLVVGPPDIPHRFTAGPDGATVLFLLTPAGLEGLVREQSVPAISHTLPSPGDQPPPDLDRMREIAERYGCELLV